MLFLVRAFDEMMIQLILRFEVLFLLFYLTYSQEICPSSVSFAIGSLTKLPWLPSAKGEGVTIFTLTEDVLLSSLTVTTAKAGENPSYCAVGRDGGLASESPAIYCVNENGKGTLTRLIFNEDMSVRSTQAETGASTPIHVAVVKDTAIDGSERIVVANRNAAVTSLTSTAARYETDVFQIEQEFASSTQGEQAVPHPHMILELGGNQVLVPDLGSDRIWQFAIADDGKLERIGDLQMLVGDGPRHLARGRSDNVYVVNELSNSIARISGCLAGGGLSICERYGLFEKATFKNETGVKAAAIRVSNDYRFIYVSLRHPFTVGEIAVFALQDDGAIGARIGIYPTWGHVPRDIFIIEKGPACRSYVAVVHRDSDNFVLFDRNTATGEIGQAVAFNATVFTPTSILELPQSFPLFTV